ncbi:HNH endonuclease [Solibaculum mannosilyticum]|uniref:HNH endonuclease n=1 Tax=Solibaculum mannosilyticum TaxID=2780922 RepID=UPI001C00187E|nr:HNH endonuclease signature motif containing protein [Solibaculum mannosilyticum]
MPRAPIYNDKRYKRARLTALRRDKYLCQRCLRYGRYTPANTTHHKIPITERPDLAFDPDNLESICPACHNKDHPEKGGSRSTNW